jgi:hypothetical protein
LARASSDMQWTRARVFLLPVKSCHPFLGFSQPLRLKLRINCAPALRIGSRDAIGKPFGGAHLRKLLGDRDIDQLITTSPSRDRNMHMILSIKATPLTVHCFRSV